MEDLTPPHPTPLLRTPSQQQLNILGPNPTPDAHISSSFVSVTSQPPQSPFNIPIISQADCFRLGQISSLIQTSPNPPTPPIFAPPPAMKRRGRPPKPKTQKIKAVPSDSTEQAEPSLSTDPTLHCWFTARQDGKSDMDIAASWCSVYENFQDWQTKPKHLAGERLAIYLVTKDHPKREARECQKKVSLAILLSTEIVK